MDKVKNILIGTIILGIIIVVIIVIAIMNIKEEMEVIEENNIRESQQGDTIIEYPKTRLNNTTLFYTIEDCINLYFDKIKNNEKNYLYDILNREYIEENKITTDNILSYVDKVKEEESFIATKMYESRNNNWYSYIIEGVKSQDDYNTKVYFIFKLDDNNLTYNIEPLFLRQYKDIKDIQIDILDKDIAVNDNNVCNYNRIKDNELIIKYLNYYTNLLQKNISSAYELLDEEYRNKRFGNIQTFKNYINLNKEKILNIEFEKYAKYKYDDYTQYVCIDKNGDYYIFNETSTMNYKIVLDTYTIDQPEFIEKYNVATNEQKAGYNINKFIKSINAKDYNYAYSCLANSFKQNKFPTLKSFEEYVKNNFFENNEFEYTNGRKEGNYYIYTLNITNHSNKLQTVQKDFIINLKENRKFEMSFEVE